MRNPNDWNKAIIEEFRANKGVVGGNFAGMTLLLLHTTSAKSGLPRMNPVAYTRDGERYVVIASKGGAPTNPDWYYNIIATPDVRVEVGTDTFRAQATVVPEPERSQLYDQMAALYPVFAEYQRKTDRSIPVIVLRRTAPEG